MYRLITCLTLMIGSIISVNTWANDSHLTVDARIEWSDPQNAEVIVTCEIADGLHIYAQSQTKPFLAVELSIAETSNNVKSVGDFRASREPIVSFELGQELHKFKETIQWRAKVEPSDPSKPIIIAGSVFAQACETQRCFAPNKYKFTAAADSNQSAVTATPSDSPSDLANIRVESETEVIDNAALASVDDASGAATPSTPAFSLSELNVAPASQSQSVWTVLPFAFIAGFLLNFMPCVLPVVGLKLLSFAQHANSDRKRVLLMNLAYSAGLVSVMLVLATLAVFAGLGWGEQFSSVGFTVTLSVIVFAFGLSFLGVWEIPLPGFIGTATGQVKQEGYAGAFTKGILGTLLATPCSGPFLGAALAWAVTQSTYLTYSVFVVVGLGMASPFLFVGIFPSTIRFLPKPGVWMETFKQAMGFVMIATVIYLLSFMPMPAVVPTALLLLGVGVSVWFAARTPLYESTAKQATAWSVAFAITALTGFIAFGWLQGVMQTRFERAANRYLENQSETVRLVSTEQTDDGKIAWQPYSPARLEAALRDGKSVFVDFTADWCLTCKSNEAAAIHTTSFANAIGEADAIALIADKTQPNPEVDSLLRKLGNAAESIPFYAYFPANDPSNPILLDGIVAGPERFVQALRQAKP